MRMDKIAAMWAAYRANGVDTKVHPDDHMFKSNPALDDYELVGESALHAIFGALAVSRKNSVYRILDFGCGHGRVARYVRAAFPQADMYFSDIDPSCVDFCANQFRGVGVPSAENLSDLELPSGMDLIWVGSVFTHIDLERMEILFDKLFGALGLGGVLIATFHGQYYYELTKSNAPKAAAYASLLRQYEDHGVGYQPYPSKTAQVGMEDWGASAIRSDKLFALGRRNPKAQMAMFSEQGWANYHDVAAWIKK